MAAARSYASPPHALYHHNAFQADYELKRQYLALLPPQQIIDICLTFDLHVPPYIKGTVWPPDINAAITALKSSRPSDSNSSENHRKDGNVIIMDSLTDREQSPHGKPAAEEQPPGPPPANVPTPSEPGPSSSDKESTQPHHLPIHPYTHAAYPHAPYYPPPSAAYPLHLHPSYPGYPLPPGGYPSFHNPLVSHASQHQDPYGAHAGDDLPSYEEMIVEALAESNDPDGCAPKDLFTWMASHYPLQSNFRPSASQALQKAFKRGRFEKTDGGKYRLNANWEGGNTSRRTTRRPQTHSQSAASNTTSTLPPPFTQTPLIHHHHHSHHPGVQTPYPGQPYGYPYAPIPPGHPQYSSFGRPPTTAPAPSDGPVDKEAKDAYETAQSILRAINFGNLLQMSSDADEAGQGTERNRAILKNTVSQTPSATTCADSPSITTPVVSGDGTHVSRGDEPRSGPEANRAQLQAQLALLAAQLAEIAEAREDGEAEDVEAVI